MTAYSPQLGARLNASHTKLNIIGISASGTTLGAIDFTTYSNFFFSGNIN